uniref:Uncharacterized protein n=1 Tax=Manihot esculenta TaxID=3983 RepID=A0A2C9VJ52_MANES
MEGVPLPFPHRAKQECSSLCNAYARAAESPSQLTWACGVSWVLEWRVPREAGFTEQRLSPASGSGRITSWCYPVPHSQMDFLLSHACRL